MPGYGMGMKPKKKMMMNYASKGKKMHPIMIEQQKKMKMNAEYKAAGGKVFTGRD